MTAHAKPWVENLVGYMRRAYLARPPSGSLDDLNALLALHCAAEERRRRRGQEQTVGERFAAERPLLARCRSGPSYPARATRWG